MVEVAFPSALTEIDMVANWTPEIPASDAGTSCGIPVASDETPVSSIPASVAAFMIWSRTWGRSAFCGICANSACASAATLGASSARDTASLYLLISITFCVSTSIACVLMDCASAIRGERANCQARPPAATTETAEMMVAVRALVMGSPR